MQPEEGTVGGGGCFGRSAYAAECPALREGGPAVGAVPGNRPSSLQICFVPQTVVQLVRFLVASEGTGSGCLSKMGIWEEGLWMAAPGDFAAGTKAKFGLSSCRCEECDF